MSRGQERRHNNTISLRPLSSAAGNNGPAVNEIDGIAPITQGFATTRVMILKLDPPSHVFTSSASRRQDSRLYAAWRLLDQTGSSFPLPPNQHVSYAGGNETWSSRREAAIASLIRASRNVSNAQPPGISDHYLHFHLERDGCG